MATSALGDVYTDLGFCAPFCFWVRSPYRTDRRQPQRRTDGQTRIASLDKVRTTSHSPPYVITYLVLFTCAKCNKRRPIERSTVTVACSGDYRVIDLASRLSVCLAAAGHLSQTPMLDRWLQRLADRLHHANCVLISRRRRLDPCSCWPDDICSSSMQRQLSITPYWRIKRTKRAMFT